MRLLIALAVGVIGFPYALAHDGEEHSQVNDIVAPSIVPEGQSEFPFDIGGEFKLVDQFGQIRTNVDAQNRPQLVFFGYANCESICSVAMPTIASAVDMLQRQNMEALPVMITIDPERDTKKIMKEKLKEIHPKFIGLTQEDKILKNVWKKFGINVTDQQIVDEKNGAVYAHGSSIFVVGKEGKVQAIMPPVVTPQRLTEIVLKYNKITN